MTYRVRAAGVVDAQAMVRIYVDSWNAGFGKRMPMIVADDDRVARWRRDLGPETPTRWWIVEQAGRPLGFVGIGPSRDPIDPALGELDTIAVAPDSWGRGVGSALMETALTSLREAGYGKAILWTLRDYPLAESFYQRHGWRLSGHSRQGGDQVRYDHDVGGAEQDE